MRKKVLITLPAYNEEDQLEKKVLQLSNFAKKKLTKIDYRIVIAENGSKDKTPTIARKLAKQIPNVDFYKHPEQGRGKALYALWEKRKTDCYVYMDVDLATDIKHTPELIDSILSKNHSLSIGTRNLKSSRVSRSLKRTIISKGYISLLKVIFKIKSSDTQCGFKAISLDAKERLWPLMDPINWTGAAWFFDAELIIIAEKIGLKIYEIPVKWNEAPDTTVQIQSTIQEDLNGIVRILKSKPWTQKSSNI